MKNGITLCTSRLEGLFTWSHILTTITAHYWRQTCVTEIQGHDSGSNGRAEGHNSYDNKDYDYHARTHTKVLHCHQATGAKTRLSTSL